MHVYLFCWLFNISFNKSHYIAQNLRNNCMCLIERAIHGMENMQSLFSVLEFFSGNRDTLGQRFCMVGAT